LDNSNVDPDLWRRSIAIRQDALEANMEAFQEKLEENTEATKRVDKNTSELVDILNSWKGAFTVLDFLGKVAKPVAAIGSVVAACVAIWFNWNPKK
jgi:hypothetical protein